MKKISCFSLIFLLFSLFFLQNNVAFAENLNNEYITIANFCYLYSAPSFKSDKIIVDGEILKINHKDVLLLKVEDGNIVSSHDEKGMLFYQVESVGEKNFDSAYVFSDYVTKNTSSIETYPAFNASINTATDLMEINGETLTTACELEKGVRVFLYEGFNGALTYTPVAVKIDNTLQYGYVLTDHITPDGINPFIIYASIIAIACIGIVIALLFMKNKKWHK